MSEHRKHMDAHAATNFQFNINQLLSPSSLFPLLVVSKSETGRFSLTFCISQVIPLVKEKKDKVKNKNEKQRESLKKKKSDTVCEGGLRRWFPGK